MRENRKYVIMIYDNEDIPLACCLDIREASNYLGIKYSTLAGMFCRKKIIESGYKERVGMKYAKVFI